MATAPTDGTPFLAYQDGEFYVANIVDGRLAFRTHELVVYERHRIIKAVMDGKLVEANVDVELPWVEEFRHDWMFWTRGFDFKPTGWAPLPETA
jgi:hypothetical protein